MTFHTEIWLWKEWRNVVQLFVFLVIGYKEERARIGKGGEIKTFQSGLWNHPPLKNVIWSRFGAGFLFTTRRDIKDFQFTTLKFIMPCPPNTLETKLQRMFYNSQVSSLSLSKNSTFKFFCYGQRFILKLQIFVGSHDLFLIQLHSNALAQIKN